MSTYVALGDSYAAGVGGGDRVDTCWRAERGYPVRVARAAGADLSYAACIGATVADVRETQLAALSAETGWVTLTIGGNDIGFTPVLVAAASPAWLNDSTDDIDRALRVLREELPDRLRLLYGEVRDRAPEATVVVTGYPRLFAAEDCQLVTFFTRSEIERLNAVADEIDALVRSLSDAAGFGFAPVRDSFSGHAVCDDEPWIHGVSLPLEESFHPTAPGHDAYAASVLRALELEAGAEGKEPVVTRVPSRGSAPVFRLPDLTGRRSRQGAAEWGLDPDRMADLAQHLDPVAARSSARTEDAAAELHAMHRQVLDRRGLPH
ncbi:hypothetical protein GCM10011519_19350 [Marmoricola endophyticus]|uniref:SGNH hydrolase-type esterase domain-containing protein n=1 Tax=Marmoricola endophyticus TaxID=2040280 RepID=A0A917F5J7_9ACTN|nr:SGNH/GDSL hydrolase family protein [Marmoricola endophyticus]GGF45571.1 hypothetical protein GCM10011519_19350 [Marmoricola endophyticus]